VKGERILLVEGPDDRHVMRNLFEVRNVPDEFKVEIPGSERDVNEGGVERLLQSIPGRMVSANLKRLAIVVDSNSKGPKARWEAIRDRLIGRGYEGVPREHSTDGTVFDVSLRPKTPRSVRLGVWIMPDNTAEGMLEDFVAQLIRPDDEMLPHVDGFIDSIPEPQRRFSTAHLPKARIHTWLAISERPGRPMGQAIKADSRLNANHPGVEPFLAWIRRALIED